jgi:hypothetical protein
MEEFVTGSHPVPVVDRVLSTIETVGHALGKYGGSALWNLFFRGGEVRSRGVLVSPLLKARSPQSGSP